jgi:hypothetical protein
MLNTHNLDQTLTSTSYRFRIILTSPQLSPLNKCENGAKKKKKKVGLKIRNRSKKMNTYKEEQD